MHLGEKKPHCPYTDIQDIQAAAYPCMGHHIKDISLCSYSHSCQGEQSCVTWDTQGMEAVYGAQSRDVQPDDKAPSWGWGI